MRHNELFKEKRVPSSTDTPASQTDKLYDAHGVDDRSQTLTCNHGRVRLSIFRAQVLGLDRFISRLLLAYREYVGDPPSFHFRLGNGF